MRASARESLRFSTEGARCRAGWRGWDSVEDARVTDSDTDLKTTPLDALHRALGAKMVPFAGYAMPLQYATGILREHLHVRASAGLFDVSHMGQLRIMGDQRVAAIERLVPGDIAALKPGRVRYTMLTNDKAGILDDLMVAKRENELALVVNAATKEADIAHIAANLPQGVALALEPDRALLALQGPKAAAILARFIPGVDRLPFMAETAAEFAGARVTLTRSGYTGEDGFELSVPADRADAAARLLLDEPEVLPIGLGARDSLRLEAGLCLYGHDIDETTTLVEADLLWAYHKRRRAEGGFPGWDVVQRQLADGPTRKRVGILPDGKAPAREHTEVTDGTARIGEITSGGFGPSVGGPVAMGYVATRSAAPGTAVSLLVRGTPRPARIVKLPFVPPRYHRGA